MLNLDKTINLDKPIYLEKSMKKMFEVFLIVIISFSPLVSKYFKVLVLLSLIVFNIGSIRWLSKRKLETLAVILFIFGISFAYDSQNISTSGSMSILNIYFPLCFVVGFVISQKYGRDELLYYLEKIIFVTAIFSLVGVLMYTFAPSAVYKLPSYNYYHTTHKTAILFNILLDGGPIPRNVGIAWEPGIYQLLLNIGAYAYIKLNKNLSIFKIIIYAVAIVTTKSTAGLIIFIIITFNGIRKSEKLRWVVLILVLLFFDALRKELLYQYEYKLVGSYSFESRLEPMINAFKIGLTHPLGLGNSGYDLTYESLDVGTFDSYGQILVRYGYAMLIAIIYLLIRVLKSDHMLFIILAITFFSQGIWFEPIITTIYFMGIRDMNPGRVRD